MIRCIALVALTAWLSANSVAGEPAQLLVVAEDHQVAAALAPLPEGITLAVLIEDHNQSFEAINSRALTMRHARHLIHSGQCESTVSAIFRERLQNHGVGLIKLREDRQNTSFDRVIVEPPAAYSIASLLENN